MNIFICYERCTTCQKARKWLDENQIKYQIRPIKAQNPTAEELKYWIQKSGLPAKKFFNTSGQLYRGMGLKEKLTGMSEDEMLELLASDGMMVKRPILVNDQTVLVGFKQQEWADKLK